MRTENYYKFFIFIIFSIYFCKFSIQISEIFLGERDFFWDLNVYVQGVIDYKLGINPYRDDLDLMFVYHPYVLKIFSIVNNLIPINIFLFLFYLLSTYFFCSQLNNYLSIKCNFKNKKNNISIIWAILPSIMFGEALISAIRIGNISIYLHFFILGMFFFGIKSISSLKIFLFITSIVIASIVKPYYLAYLILLIYYTSLKKSITLLAATCIFVFAIWISAHYFTADLYQKYLDMLFIQGFENWGYSVLGLLINFTSSTNAFSLHLLLMLLTLLGFIFFIYQKKYKINYDKFIPLTIIYIIVMNPRMAIYDFPIAIIFIIVFIYAYNQEIYIKAISLGILVSSVPLLTNILELLGLIEYYWYLNLIRYYQIFGFLCLSIFVFIFLKNLKVNYSKN